MSLAYTWFKNLNNFKIAQFLHTHFKDKFFEFNFVNNSQGEKFIEVSLANINEPFEVAFYLSEFYVLSPYINLDKFSEMEILYSVEDFQDLFRSWVKFLYELNKDTKIDNQTYKEALTEKLNKNLLNYYENTISFAINNYLQNQNGFTESATFDTIKEFKKEYDEEKANLPKVINALLNGTKKDEKNLID